MNKLIALLCVAVAAFVGYRVFETRQAAPVVVPVVIVPPAPPIETPPVVVPKAEHQAPKRRPKPVHEHIKPVVKGGVVTPQGENGPHVPYNCKTLQGYVDKFGVTLMKSMAGNYGYSQSDVDGALKKCGIQSS